VSYYAIYRQYLQHLCGGLISHLNTHVTRSVYCSKQTFTGLWQPKAALKWSLKT